MTTHLKKISKYRPSALQGTLHFEAARPRARLAAEHPWEPRARSILLIALTLLVAAYLYFVAASILNVIARQDALGEMQTAQSMIAVLERNYLAISEDVTAQEGARLGFAPISNTSYVHRPGRAALAEVPSDEI